MLSRRDLLFACSAAGAATTGWFAAAARVAGPSADVLADAGPLPEATAATLRRLAHAWRDGVPGEVLALRRMNPEWDLLTRMFTALALADAAHRDPSWRPLALTTIDALVDGASASVAERGDRYFLLPYAASGAFVQQPARSLFVDGELALMIAARRLLADDRPELAAAFTARCDAMAERLAAAPLHAAESYPDECWAFCNTVALAALTAREALDGVSAADLRDGFLAAARATLREPDTGLLVSSFRVDGTPKDGPEGSSIYLAAHMLQAIDPELAREQYALAEQALGHGLLGFRWAAEWPAGHRGPRDVDSGEVLPFLDASPSASGFALMAARAFGDTERLRGLLASVALGAIPIDEGGERRFAAGNLLGDAVIGYGLVAGPTLAAIAARRSS